MGGRREYSLKSCPTSIDHTQYFGKPKFRPALRTDGKDDTLPDQLKDDPKFQEDKGTLDTADADAVAHTPPDPLWPSGICSVIVHQIVNLELENVKGSDGNRKGKEFEPAKAYGEATEEESSSKKDTTRWRPDVLTHCRASHELLFDPVQRPIGLPYSSKGRQQQADFQCRHRTLHS